MSDFDWVTPGIGLAVYLALGVVLAIVREYRRGSLGKSEDPDFFFAIIAFWPVVLPVLWLWALCRWVWAIGFNRNLPPLNQHPTARERKR